MDILPSTPTVASLSLTLQLLFLQFFRCITWGIFPSANLVHCEDSSYVAQIFVSPFFLFFFIMEFRKQYVTFILLFCFIFWSSMTLCVLLFVFSVLYVLFSFLFLFNLLKYLCSFLLSILFIFLSFSSLLSVPCSVLSLFVSSLIFNLPFYFPFKSAILSLLLFCHFLLYVLILLNLFSLCCYSLF